MLLPPLERSSCQSFQQRAAAIVETGCRWCCDRWNAAAAVAHLGGHLRLGGLLCVSPGSASGGRSQAKRRGVAAAHRWRSLNQAALLGRHKSPLLGAAAWGACCLAALVVRVYQD